MWFELNVRVPFCGIVTPLVLLKFMFEHLLPRLRANMTDLCITNTKFRSIVQHWMDVKRRIGGFTTQLPKSMNEELLEFI